MGVSPGIHRANKKAQDKLQPKKVLDGPNCLQAFHMEWNGEGGLFIDNVKGKHHLLEISH